MIAASTPRSFLRNLRMPSVKARSVSARNRVQATPRDVPCERAGASTVPASNDSAGLSPREPPRLSARFLIEKSPTGPPPSLPWSGGRGMGEPLPWPHIVIFCVGAKLGPAVFMGAGRGGRRGGEGG